MATFRLHTVVISLASLLALDCAAPAEKKPELCPEGSLTPESSALTGGLFYDETQPSPGALVRVFDAEQPTAELSSTTTDESGGYRLSLGPKELLGADGAARRLLLNIDRASSFDLNATFRPRAAAVTVPRLQSWHSMIRELPTGPSQTLSWVPLNAQQHALPPATTELQVLALDGQMVWRIPNPRNDVVRLEEWMSEGAFISSLVAVLSARTTVCSDATRFELQHLGGPLAWNLNQPLVPEPPSRNTPCTSDGFVTQSPCPVTDGLLINQLSNHFQTPPKFITVDLGAPKTVRRVVLRQLIPTVYAKTDPPPDHQLSIESSTDGVEFERIAGPLKLSDPTTEGCFTNDDARIECWLRFEFATVVAARYVKVSMEQNLPEQGGVSEATISSLTELSVWP